MCYSFIVGGFKSLKTFVNDEVAFIDRDWKDARVGVADIKVKRRLRNKNGIGYYCFVEGKMLETDEITNHDVTDVITDEYSESDKLKVYVERGKNGFILVHDEAYGVYSNIVCFVKVNGVLVSVNVNSNLNRLLTNIYTFKPYYQFAEEYVLDSDAKKMEAIIRLANEHNYSLRYDDFEISIFNNRYIVICNRVYVYDTVSHRAFGILRSADDVETSCGSKVSYKRSEIVDFMVNNGIIMSHSYRVVRINGESDVISAYNLKTKSGADFCTIDLFNGKTFTSEMLDNVILTDIVKHSIEDYHAYCNRCRKNLTSKNVDEYKECMSLKKVLGVEPAPMF